MRTNFLLLLLILVTWFSCGGILNSDGIDYRAEMRTFVQEISSYAKSQQSDFAVIPQNGHPLLLNEDGSVASAYLSSVDGLAQESVFFGYSGEDMPTPATETNRLLQLLNIGKDAGKTILTTDYCFSSFKVNNSYAQNQAAGFVSFAAPVRELTVIPGLPSPLYGENAQAIGSLDQVQNFLYLLNKENFSTKQEFIDAVRNTNYDLLITDAFFNDSAFTEAEVSALRQKRNGGQRMVISYMSIGEAEDYRYYWQEGWEQGNPDWLAVENPNWPGNYKVKYWDPEWQAIITGNKDSYLQLILDAGYDGVYLDIIDGFEYFENR